MNEIHLNLNPKLRGLSFIPWWYWVFYYFMTMGLTARLSIFSFNDPYEEVYPKDFHIHFFDPRCLGNNGKGVSSLY